jgi:hypothetical protein
MLLVRPKVFREEVIVSFYEVYERVGAVQKSFGVFFSHPGIFRQAEMSLYLHVLSFRMATRSRVAN